MIKIKTVSFKIEEDLLERLDAYAKKHKITRTDALKQAIGLLLKEESRNETIKAPKVEKIKLK